MDPVPNFENGGCLACWGGGVLGASSERPRCRVKVQDQGNRAGAL